MTKKAVPRAPRITFAKHSGDRWSGFQRYVVKVDGEVVGGVGGGYLGEAIGWSINSGALDGKLAWKNTWSDKEAFASFNEAKASCKRYLLEKLSRAGGGGGEAS